MEQNGKKIYKKNNQNNQNKKNKKNKVELPSEIIDIIINDVKIECWTCKVKYNLNFYKKLDKNYYCSEECFNHF